MRLSSNVATSCQLFSYRIRGAPTSHLCIGPIQIINDVAQLRVFAFPSKDNRLVGRLAAAAAEIFTILINNPALETWVWLFIDALVTAMSCSSVNAES